MEEFLNLFSEALLKGYITINTTIDSNYEGNIITTTVDVNNKEVYKYTDGFTIKKCNIE